MIWIDLTSKKQLDEITLRENPSVIFKHSTRCPISGMAKRSFEADSHLLSDKISFYFLDLIIYREISDEIAVKWNIRHQSPQVLLILRNECIYNASHESIEVSSMIKNLESEI